MARDSPARRRLSHRGRRAVGLIVIALTVVLAASVAYLYPNLISTTTAPPGSSQSQVTADAITYNFVSPLVGWALDFSENRPETVAGRFWILRTVDGAKHWERQLAAQNGYSSFSSDSIQMFDAEHGFVYVHGATDALFRTVDGGANWRPIALPTSVAKQVTFSDPLHGWLLASASQSIHLYATQDGGDRWQQLPDPPADSLSIAFRGPSQGWIGRAGGLAHVYASFDGGFTWVSQDLPANATSTGASVRLLPRSGVLAFLIAGDGSMLEFTSFDAGNTWQYLPPRPREVFPGGESFVDASDWWAMDKGVLYKSSDAGQTWTAASDQLGSGFWQYSVNVLDSKHAWIQLVIGKGTGLALTNDGGRNWTRALVPQPT